MAPELLGEGDVASKVRRESDIWALGCVFLEVIACVKPYEAYQSNLPVLSAITRHRFPHESYSTSSRVTNKPHTLTPNLVEEIEPAPPSFSQYPGLWALCLQCWNLEPTSRPNCSDMPTFFKHLKFMPQSLESSAQSKLLPSPSLDTSQSWDESICHEDKVFGELNDLTANITYVENKSYSAISSGDTTLFPGQYKGLWVAVKVTRSFHSSGTNRNVLLRRLRNGMSLWARLKHENILPLAGFCFFPRYSVSPVTLWMKNGSAPSYVQNNPDACRVELLLGITNGLAYCHSQGLIHGDIRGTNILISDDGRPMLAGFVPKLHTTEDEKSASKTLLQVAGLNGTPRWMAPEVVKDLLFSTESDVWALGN
ncbi:kinase-like protein [Sistotremastrum suecicum HHB10207 ss-3]|uniref:Kinase-like protein n=1 Tax=Sistotremastrum suecicum HHB10207 ss-3 TaxID=1314776 RepID=A0A165XJ46_9AGAM|nr:kinase-like protein [Sistotremastrum suecicum HHB10207 ss-3]